MQLEIGQLDRKYAGLRIEDRARRSQLTASLLEHGQQTPIVVVPSGEEEQYVLIDGYLRVAALETLSRDLVEALVLALSEADALVISHRVDGRRRLQAQPGLSPELEERRPRLRRRRTPVREGQSPLRGTGAPSSTTRATPSRSMRRVTPQAHVARIEAPRRDVARSERVEGVARARWRRRLDARR